MSITQNQIRTSYILLVAVSNTAPEIYSGDVANFELGDSYYNTQTHRVHTIIQDSEDSPLYWGVGEAPIESHLYLDTSSNVFYGVNNGVLFANIGTGELTNPMSSSLDMNSFKIMNLANGISNKDAVNKGQLDLKANISDVVLNSEKAVANGVATLGEDAKVMSSQLPSLPIGSTTTAGIVKPDGVTLNTTIDGTLSVSAESLVYRPNLLEFRWSDHLFNNISWLRADTFSWQNGNLYSAVYNELLAEYNNAESVTESIVLDTSWEQPTLSANGLIGGNSFAVSTDATPYNNNFVLWKGFDNTSNTAFHTNAAVTNVDNAKYIIMYSPVAIKCSSITFTNYYENYPYASSSGIVYGSNDGITWEELKVYTNSITGANQNWDIDLSQNNNFYKYYKVLCTGTVGNTYWAFSQCTLNATEFVNQITYKKTPKNYFIADSTQEQNILSAYNSRKAAWFFILDTANTRFKLPRAVHGHGQLVESKVSGTEWYRIYADGWCEQGGRVLAPSAAKVIRVPLHKQYKNIDYTITAATGDLSGGNYQYTSGFNWQWVTVRSLTASSFDVFSGNFACSSWSWEAKGYISTPENPFCPQYKYLYFYVGNFSQSANEQTAGLNAELFNTKADIDLNNISTTSGVRKLVEVYKNGTEWYKVFAEYDPSTGDFVGNWCEQGGKRAALATDAGLTINLLKPFVNTNYLVLNISIGSSSGQAKSNCILNNQTTTSFILVQDTYGDSGGYWKAEGYIS